MLGIVGEIGNHSILSNCVNYGKITGRGDLVGGIAGFNAGGIVEKSSNYGDVTLSGNSLAYFGGIVGGMQTENGADGIVTECVNFGTLSGTKYRWRYLWKVLGKMYYKVH